MNANSIDFSSVNDERMVGWYHGIAPGGPQADMVDAGELPQVKAEIMRRGLDLSPAIDRVHP